MIVKLVILVQGETTRKGFYVYNDKRKASPDPELKKYIEKSREISGISVDPKVIFSLFFFKNKLIWVYIKLYF